MARSTGYERRNGRDEAASTAAILLREIRERVPLCDDLAGEIVRRRDAEAARPVIRRRGRGRAERPA